MPDPEPVLARPSETEERFRLLVEHSPDMMALYSAEGRLTFASGAYERVLGYPSEALAEVPPLDLVHPEDVERVRRAIARQIVGAGPAAPVEFRFRLPDGRYRDLEAVIVNLLDEPSVQGILVASRDVTDRKRAETAVRDQARVLERIARGAPIAEVLDDLCTIVEHRLDAFGVVFVARGRTMEVAAAPGLDRELRVVLDSVSGQPGVRARLRDGPVFGAVGDLAERSVVVEALRAAGLHGWWAAPIYASDGREVLGTLTVLHPERRDPIASEEQTLGTVASLAAIALERDRTQSRLAHQAYHDPLTGLPNRDQLLERLEAVVEFPGPGTSAVLFLDLDRFKVFNDSVGHDAGDKLLVAVARRLRGALREGDLVARFGGDEFVVLCERLASPDEVLVVADRLRAVVERPFVVDGAELVVTASVGVALVDGRTAEVLLRDADAAMYHAKDRGRARVEVFDERLRARVVDRLEIERDLRRALDRGELVLHYQPVVALHQPRFAGFEALVRWEHPTRGLLGPGEFLPVAEEAGLLGRIGLRTQREAIAQLAAWQAAHPEWGEFVMGVNLAPAELRDGSLPEQVGGILTETGVDPRLVVLEASERVLAEDTETARAVLDELRGLGVMLALDDFGTGASPLLHLRRFPISAVKLDGELIAGLGVNRDDNVLVAGVIELAHRLGMFVVAEGVEEAAQIARLRAYGCLFAQGHHVAPALAVDEAAAWVDAYGLCWEDAVRSR